MVKPELVVEIEFAGRTADGKVSTGSQLPELIVSRIELVKVDGTLQVRDGMLTPGSATVPA